MSVDPGGNDRQWAREKRDFVADAPEETADRREVLADARRAVADDRELAADTRESHLDQWERQLARRAAELGLAFGPLHASPTVRELDGSRVQALEERRAARRRDVQEK
jgi:hypothetical protein